MNEEQKNIETCLPESILAEVASVPTDPQFVSLVEESFDPLQQQAVQQAGSDAYNEVVASHQPYTFTSQVAQMKSNLILLLRRLWRFPFGSGTLRSIADMWEHYITRLQGSETYGIPSRLDQLTDLPSAPLLVADRKISGADVEDGISLVRLLCDTTAASDVTELVDDNVWDEYLRDSQSDITSKFPNLDKLTFGARIIRINSKNIVLFNKNLSYLYFPNLEEFYGVMTTTSFNGSITNSSAITKLEMPELKRIDVQYSELGPISRQSAVQIAKGCTSLREVLMPSLTYMPPNLMTSYENYMFTSCPNIEKMVLGKLTALNPWITQYALNTPMENLIHFEIGAGTAISLNLAYWNPSYILSDNPTGTDLIEEGSTAANNLEQFLQNFRDYIADRLTDNGSGKTLTLSQAVRNAIHAAEATYGIENIIITQKGWTISPAPN